MRVNIIVHGVPQLWMCHENLSSPERGRSTTFNIYKLYVISFIYDSIATVGEIRVYRRADFQSGSRVLKKVF